MSGASQVVLSPFSHCISRFGTRHKSTNAHLMQVRYKLAQPSGAGSLIM